MEKKPRLSLSSTLTITLSKTHIKPPQNPRYSPKTPSPIPTLTLVMTSVADLISPLPYGVIFKIQSFLPIKDAAKMSALSSTWRHLSSFSPLHLHDSDLIPQSQFDNEASSFSAQGNKKWAEKKRCAEIIDQILTSPSNFDRPIHSFILSRFFLPYIGNDTLIRWFEIITERGIQRLALGNDGFPLYPIPRCSLFKSQTLTELKLQYCIVPLYSVSFPRLRILDLEQTRLSDECLDGILSKSPALERLKMSDCRGVKRIRIRSESMRIVSLETCFLFPVEGIVIEKAPNLVEIILNEHAREVVSVTHDSVILLMQSTTFQRFVDH